MLKGIRLKNFKPHKDTSIEAAPITVFIGPNNSGKSSIFQEPLALRQAAVRGDNVFCQPLERSQTLQGQARRGSLVTLVWAFEPQRGDLAQPRATPWVKRPNPFPQALKGQDR